MSPRRRGEKDTALGWGWTSGRGLAAVLVVLLILLPLAMLVVGSLRTAPPGQPGSWTFDNLRRTYTTPATFTAIGSSLLLAVTATLISTTLGTAFAFVSARTNVPGRRLLTPIMLLLVALPPLLYGLSWGLLGAPRIGLIAKVPFLSWFDVNSWAGLILVVSLKGTGFAYLLLIGPVRRFDMALLESGRVFGGTGLGSLLRVGIPMLASPILAAAILNFVVSFALFDIPQIIGFPAGIRVFSTRMYAFLSTGTEPQYGQASSLALFLVAVLVLLAFAHGRVTRGLDVTTVGGRGYSEQPWVLGRWRWAGSVVIAVFLVASVLAPFAQLVLGAFQPIFGVYGSYTLSNFTMVLSDPQVRASVWVTVRTAVGSGFVAMVLAFMIAYLSARRRDRFSGLLSHAMWLPWAMPGIVLALGITWAIVEVPGLQGLYGSNTVVLAGLVVIALPIATRSASAAIAQVSPQLEEASRVFGATSGQTFRSIVLRLVLPSFAAGWFLCVILTAGILDLPLVLAGRTDPPFPVVLFSMYQTGQTAEAAAACVLLAALVIVVGTLFLAGRRLARHFAHRDDAIVRAAVQSPPQSNPTAAPSPTALVDAHLHPVSRS
jgi:iron(III) transport system permease protein